MTKQEGKYRMLFSPPLQMHQTDTSLMFHTSKFLPALHPSSQNEILFTHKKTPYLIYLDSTKVKTLYGRLQIPLDKIISDNINLWQSIRNSQDNVDNYVLENKAQSLDTTNLKEKHSHYGEKEKDLRTWHFSIAAWPSIDYSFW